MRKNTVEVFNAWMNGKALNRHRSIHTNGYSIYSYGTLLVMGHTGHGVLFNGTKYSPTTSRQQGDIGVLISRHGIDTVTVNGVRMGCQDLTPYVNAD
jgi:hypothetical protein